MLFVHALVLSGVSMTRGLHAPGTGKACLISFDVCGHGAPSGTVGNFELPPFISTGGSLYFPAIQVYPPTTDLAVATADIRDTEKPPEA